MKKLILLSLLFSSTAFSSVTSSIVNTLEKIASEGKVASSKVSRVFDDAANVSNMFRGSVEPGFQMSLRSRSGGYLFIYSNPSIWAGEFKFPGGVLIKYVKRIGSPYGPEGRNFPAKRAVKAALADIGIAGEESVLATNRLFGGYVGDNFANYREELVVLPVDTVKQLTLEDIRFVLEKSSDI